MSSPLQLYVDARFISPFAMFAFVALHEKSLPFELITVDLAQQAQHAPDYIARSLTNRVPTLSHGDFHLSESSAITEYLDATFPGTDLYPRDIPSRARALQVQSWLRTDLMPLRQERSTDHVFYRTASTMPLSPEASQAKDKLLRIAATLLPAGHDYLFGDWSIADIELALMLNRLVLGGDPVPEHLASYATHQWQRPSVQQWLTLPRPAL